ncbi:MAG: hypothetical protein K1X88_10205 [Nannocystaceae bacterium]|nr:hypothetical protein [Nannocystaceae bacterium]
MRLTPARQVFVLAAAAAVPVTVGIHMHLEHLEVARACALEAPSVSESVPQPAAISLLPVPTPVVAVAPAPVVAVAGPPASALEFAHVIHAEGALVVLATTVDPSWAVDPPHTHRPRGNDLDDVPAFRNVALERLPEAARVAIGRSMTVWSPTGHVCTATVGRPVLVGEAWGAREYLEGAEDDAARTPTSDAEELWQNSRVVLAAPLASSEDCSLGLWARDAELSTPRIYLAQSDDDLPSPVARRLLQRDPAVRKAAREFDTFARETLMPQDDEGADADAFTTRRLVDRFVGRRWIDPSAGGELDIFVTEGDEFGGCGGFGPSWGAVSIDREGTPFAAAYDELGDSALAVFDLEGDGRPEVLTEQWLGPTQLLGLSEDGETFARRSELAPVPFWGCPC